MINLHVYILHCKVLESRKGLCESLRKKLEKASSFKLITFDYIEKYDVSELSKEDVEKYVNLEKSPTITPFDVFLQGIHIRKLSNALKHYEALKLVSEKPQNDFGLILEDDAVYSENVEERLSKTIEKLIENPDNLKWDLNFLGFPQPVSSDSNIKISPVQTVFKLLPDISSYLVRPASALELSKHFLPIRFQTNIHFSYLTMEKRKGEFSYTMSTPNVFVDGSKFGVYLSSIKPNNKLLFNQDYTRLYKMVHEKDTFTTDEINEFYKIFESAKFNTHPEFQTVLGKFEMKQKNYNKAKEIFDKCYELYVSNDCLLNGESEFLETYAHLFKYLQNDIS